MTRLIKSVTTTYIPAVVGSSGTPYVPAQPASLVWESNTICAWSSGYEWIQADDGQYYYIPATSTYSCVTTSGFVYYPGTAEIPGTPYVAPIPEQFTVWKNSGWNSYASSIDTLVSGGYIEFTVPMLTRGALLAVDDAFKEGDLYTDFAHGLMVDTSGIYVFEYGVSTLLQASRSPTEKIRIYRIVSGQIVYTTQSGAVHVSATSTNPAATKYVYGLLYEGYDEVSSAEIGSWSLSINTEVRLAGTGSLVATPASRALLEGTSSLLAVSGAAGFATALMTGTSMFTAYGSLSAPSVLMAGSSALFAEADVGGRATAYLPYMASLGGDYDYGVGVVTLPIFTGSGAGGFYIPEALTEGYGQIPYLSGYAVGFDNDVGTSTSSLPYFSSIGADFAYGFGSGSLPTMFTSGSAGDVYADDELWLLSSSASVSTFTPALDLVLVLNSSGMIESSFSMTREQALAFMSSITGGDQYTFVGTFDLSILSLLRSGTPQSLQIREQADLVSNGVVWVVNLANGASTQYEQYGFNSFFVRAGIAYGVANNGIYKLDGTTDSGEIIEALVMTGKSDFTTKNVKTLPAVYIGLSSTDEVILKVDADGTSVYYTARSTNTDLENQRVDIGKGLRGRYWQFTLLNSGGCDFDLEGINFTPVNTSRSI